MGPVACANGALSFVLDEELLEDSSRVKEWLALGLRAIYSFGMS
jgi:hypothetical protein